MSGDQVRERGNLRPCLAAICAVAAIALFADRALAVATLGVSTSDDAPGGTVRLVMGISRAAGDPPFAGVGIDIIINRSQLEVHAECSGSGTQCDSGLDCQDGERCDLVTCEFDPRLPAVSQKVAYFPRFQNVAPDQKRIRLQVIGPAIPVVTFGDGLVLTCDLNIPASASLGEQNLASDRIIVSDENGDVIATQADIMPGRIVDPSTLPPTNTPNILTPSRTPTVTRTRPPTGTASPSRTPTATRTPTPRIVRIEIGEAETRPGSTVSITASLFTAGLPVAATANDIVFDETSLSIDPGTCASRVAGKTVLASSPEAGVTRVFVQSSSDNTRIADGPLYTCTVAVRPSALPATYDLLTDSVLAFDLQGGSHPLVVGIDGAVTVSLVPRRCSGDCDGDDVVTVDEVVRLVSIALGTSRLDRCSAGDADGDGVITVDEIVAAIQRALTGC